VSSSTGSEGIPSTPLSRDFSFRSCPPVPTAPPVEEEHSVMSQGPGMYLEARKAS
jgi:hypothetical protein